MNNTAPTQIAAPDYMSLTEAAHRLPGRNGGTRNPSCVWRWAMRGVRGVRLQTERIGGVHYTTWQWVQEFLADLRRKDKPVQGRTMAQAKRDHDAAVEYVRHGCKEEVKYRSD
jgi:hypothetical protein